MKLLAIPAARAATSLLALTAIAFDTEATSLDVKAGRVLEIGAVAVLKGQLAHDQSFSSYVQPGVAIPAESTEIHGITVDRLAGAPGFIEAHRAFRQFCGSHLLLGYSLAFDLQLLEAEHARAGAPWKPPQSLDVASLVRLLRPALPDYALETVAHWLGITVENRHRALGDAVLTAKVFLALVPLLRQRNIRTLGEALTACRALDREETGARVSGHADQTLPNALARADSYPYRHRISDVMSAPPLTVLPSSSVVDAIGQMLARKVSSLFVAPDKARSPWGIITERDVLRAVASEREAVSGRPVRDFASRPLQTVRGDDFLYVALGRMYRAKIRHLGVVDGAGKLVGALSQRDLLRLRAEEALALSHAMSDSATAAELAGTWRQLADAAQALVLEDMDARDIAAIVSGEVCALTARAARMAEAEISQQSPRPPGLAYAVMVLGSGGRGESLLALDQDNAIIFDCPDTAAADAWLGLVAERMNVMLDTIGVPLCKGGVMARNPDWRLSVAGWRQRIARWLSRNTPQDIMNADIFFDALPVHGDAALADDLRNHAMAAAAQTQAFLKLMSLAAIDVGSPFTWLGRIAVDEQGRVDLKRHGIMPIFTAARVAALRYGIAERSTPGRLGALRGNPDFPPQQLELITEAHGLLLGFILRQQLEDISAGIPPSNRVNPKTFSALEREHLTWALKQVPGVADIVGASAV